MCWSKLMKVTLAVCAYCKNHVYYGYLLGLWEKRKKKNVISDSKESSATGLIYILFALCYTYIILDFLIQIVGFSVAVIFFALMRQAHARPIPSILKAVESNLRIPFPFLPFAVVPILFSLFFSFLTSQPFPPFSSFTIVSIICYLLANGFVILLILVSQLIFYVAAYLHVFIKRRLVNSLPFLLY